MKTTVFFLVYIAWEALFGYTFSVFNLVNGWSRGVAGILNALFGLPLFDHVDVREESSKENAKYALNDNHQW